MQQSQLPLPFLQEMQQFLLAIPHLVEVVILLVFILLSLLGQPQGLLVKVDEELPQILLRLNDIEEESLKLEEEVGAVINHFLQNLLIEGAELERP